MRYDTDIINLKVKDFNVKKVPFFVYDFTYFAGPFASFIVKLPGSHHHGLVHHITSLLGELLIFLLWGRRPGGRNLALRKRRFGWCCLIVELQGQVKVIMVWPVVFWTLN